MNLFVIGWAPRGAPAPGAAEAAVTGLAGALPFPPDAGARTWRSPAGSAGAAWAGSAGGGAEGSDERLTLWAGRPVAWEGERAEGRVGPAQGQAGGVAPSAASLDGRYAQVVCTDHVGVVADALGAYPLYRADVNGVVWLSNRAEPLRALAGSR